jgi:hypothetical protein
VSDALGGRALIVRGRRLPVCRLVTARSCSDR